MGRGGMRDVDWEHDAYRFRNKELCRGNNKGTRGVTDEKGWNGEKNRRPRCVRPGRMIYAHGGRGSSRRRAAKTVLILCLPLYRPPSPPPKKNSRFSPFAPPARQTNITTNLYGLYNTRVSAVEEVRIYFVYARESRPTPPCRRDRRIRAYGLIIFSLATKRETLTHARAPRPTPAMYSFPFYLSPRFRRPITLFLVPRRPFRHPYPFPRPPSAGATSPRTIQ